MAYLLPDELHKLVSKEADRLDQPMIKIIAGALNTYFATLTPRQWKHISPFFSRREIFDHYFSHAKREITDYNLTDRERSIRAAIKANKTQKQIADDLALTPPAVHYIVKQLREAGLLDAAHFARLGKARPA